jgi:hypothetical protein
MFNIFKPRFIVLFHMKSGKTVTVKNVKEFTFKHTGSRLTGYDLQYSKNTRNGLVINEVEAVEAVQV